MTNQRCLSLIKGQHRYLFRYFEGRETEVLAAFVQLAGDPEHEFDWYDAAVMSYQMGKRLNEMPQQVA